MKPETFDLSVNNIQRFNIVFTVIHLQLTLYYARLGTHAVAKF